MYCFYLYPHTQFYFWFIGQYINTTIPLPPDYNRVVIFFFFGWSPTLRARIKMYCQWPVFKQQNYPTVSRLSGSTVDDR